MRIPRVSIAVMMGLVGLVAVDLALINFCLGVNTLSPYVLAALEFLGMGNALSLALIRYLGHPGRFLRAFLISGTVVGLASLLMATRLMGWSIEGFLWLTSYLVDVYTDQVEPLYSGSPNTKIFEWAASVGLLAIIVAVANLPQVIVATASAWFFSRRRSGRKADSIEEGGAE